MNPIEADSAAAVATRNGSPARARNGNRPPSARARIEAAAAAAQAAEQAMADLYANPLIARLDLEGLGCDLAEHDLDAILTLVRSLDARVPLPQRQPGNGTGPQRQIDGGQVKPGQRL